MDSTGDATTALAARLILLQLVDQSFDQIGPHSEHPPVADDGGSDASAAGAAAAAS